MIHREDHDSIAVLRLDHGKVHALDTELLEDLVHQLTTVTDGSVAGVVLTGTGSAFCAGVDLFRLLDDSPEYRERFTTLLSTSMRELFTCPLPVVAAINGHAIAGGCILAAACDHRVMAEGKAVIGVTELLVGLPFPVIGIEILRALLAPHVLSQLVYRGATMAATAAAGCGLVDEVTPAGNVMDRALAVAHQLAAVPPETWRLTKEQLRQPIIDAIDRNEARHGAEVRAVWESADAHTAIRAFLERTIRKS